MGSNVIFIHMKHTEETRKLLSEKRKKWLAENPEKHVWKRHSKFKSVPCERLKEILMTKGMVFVEEYTPRGINYSIDIAFPDKLIGIEVNGNQHYERDGRLKDYYAQRQTKLESMGWKIVQLPYSMCFFESTIQPIIDGINQTTPTIPFSYETYVPPEKKVYVCVDCKKKVGKGTIRCMTCNGTHRKELNNHRIPNKEMLTELLSSHSFVSVGKMYGVSDNAVRKWCRRCGLNPKLARSVGVEPTFSIPFTAKNLEDSPDYNRTIGASGRD